MWTRILNAFRRYLEDRRAPEADYLQQLHAVWTSPVIRPKRAGYLNLTVYREAASSYRRLLGERHAS